MKSVLLHTAVCLGGMLALALLTRPGHAEVLARDWKEPGDGLLTYDNVNGREWLDLSETLLEQFAEPEAEFPEDHYANVVAELGPGGLFEGFTVAKSDDVIALAESAGIDPTTTDFDVNGIPMTRLMDLIDVTLVTPIEVRRSHGFLDEFTSEPVLRCPCRSLAVFRIRPSLAQAQLHFGVSGNLQNPASITGVMLYRTAIPEPNSVWLAMACAAALAVVSQRKVKKLA